MKPDLVMFGGMDSVAAPMAKQMKELGMKAPLMGGDGVCDPGFITIAGDAAGVLTCSVAGRALEKMARGEDFEKRYKQKFGTECQRYSPYSYDAVYAIVDGLKRAGRPDRLALVATRGEIDVGEVALHHLEQLQVLRTMQAVSKRAEDAKRDLLRLRLLDQLECTVDVVEVGDRHQQ